jgi:hypothetical protein
VVATLATAVALALVDCGGSKPDLVSSVKANEALLRDLPTYPGADLGQRFTIPHREEEDGPIVGYITISDYVLPRTTQPGDVVLFYEQRLKPQWDLLEPAQTGRWLLTFRKGDAVLWIDPDGWEEYQLEVAVNHDYYGR